VGPQVAAATLQLGPVGAFPNQRRPQTIWAGVAGATADLSRLYQAVGAALAPLGFAPDTRPFQAHLTLGRVRRDATPAQRSRLGSAIAALPAPPPLSWQSGVPALFQSTLTPRGALYQRIDDEPPTAS
jgi:2'-5' RNA ligase